MFIGYGRKGAGEKIIARAENKNADTAASEIKDNAVTADNTVTETVKTERKKKTTVSVKEAEANG